MDPDDVPDQVGGILALIAGMNTTPSKIWTNLFGNNNPLTPWQKVILSEYVSNHFGLQRFIRNEVIVPRVLFNQVGQYMEDLLRNDEEFVNALTDVDDEALTSDLETVSNWLRTNDYMYNFVQLSNILVQVCIFYCYKNGWR